MAAAEELGNVTCNYIGPGEHTEAEQVQIVQDLITQGVDGIAVAPSNAPAMARALRAAQEAGIPVTYGYISDIHERKAGTSNCTTASATGSGKPIGPGDSCYVSNAKAYDAAFASFFDRLQKDGITPANTEFVISAEENDQLAGANVGRASQPTP